eukprot:gene8493-10089_t
MLLPTEVEQPNGDAVNKAAEELNVWAAPNLRLATWDRHDDHANLQMDVVYNMRRLVQACRERKGDARRC